MSCPCTAVIWDAIRGGAIIENVVLDDQGQADYSDTSLTENGRCCYPLEHVDKRSETNAGGEPKCVIFLTCDVFGVLPPISILSKRPPRFTFSRVTPLGLAPRGRRCGGYQPHFSTCFGAPFMPRPAGDYAELLIKRIEDFDSQVYLINTGWTGGSGAPGGSGSRFPIPVTRAVVKAAQDGVLVGVETRHIESLNLDYPVSIPGVDDQYVDPKAGWGDDAAYEAQASQLAALFLENIANFDVSEAIVAAGPKSAWSEDVTFWNQLAEVDNAGALSLSIRHPLPQRTDITRTPEMMHSVVLARRPHGNPVETDFAVREAPCRWSQRDLFSLVTPMSRWMPDFATG